MDIPRFYYPKYLPANEIVKRAGFVPTKNGMGWERDVSDNGKKRIHAMTHEVYRIDVHQDIPGTANPNSRTHRTYRRHPLIAKAIEDFGRIDRAAATPLTLAVEFITRPFKKSWERW